MGKEPTVLPAAMSHKEEGNRLFGMGKYSAAIEAYTNAALEAPTWPVPFVNRALCLRKRQDWTRMIEDSERALQLDCVNVKATFMLGVGQLKLGRVDAAVRTLSKAMELARERGAAMQDDIWRALARAKFTAFLQSPAPGLAERRRSLEGRLGALLRAEAARRAEAGEAYWAEEVEGEEAGARAESGAGAQSTGVQERAGDGGGAGGGAEQRGGGHSDAEPMSTEAGEGGTSPPADGAGGADGELGDAGGAAPADGGTQLVPSSAEPSALAASHRPPEPPTLASDLLLLRSAFAAADAGSARADPPAEFCCPLTLDVFRDPVLGPCGHSYERSALLDHLAKVGEFDPITRKPLRAAQLVTNVGLRVAAHAWLDAHPWAYGDICGADDGADD